ncbi:hypothetical protein [Wenzhouxiangella marina]|uniref:Uncharacterized protein n=1 Tax=Wenzhouxiangella marina TaxID=1579979 RepID=A0A0K0XXW6_9GAMM|nr:hypothetical protein [Wenzhouxiangella marina]AKS42544.1 hypothetical protein WM2015_2181 [Wenzhouxiangella marina]MBB6085678.1 hypothetical protein [Wenzhouxiangella marina]
MIDVYGRGFLAIAATVFALASAGPALADSVADSVKEFSGEQGLNGWTYGYWDESDDADGKYDQATDFELFERFGDDSINGLSSHSEFTTGELWYLDDGRYYTSLWAEGGHAHGDMNLGSYARADHWVIRRWSSTVDGPIEISGQAGKVMPWGQYWSGSTRFMILAGGVTVYDAELEGAGEAYAVSATVEVGTAIDFLIGPGSAIGVVRFTAALSEP